MTRWVLAALLVLASGCGAETVSLARGPRPFVETDYEDIYERWTRDENSFSWAQMTDVLRVSATFESWEFRWAYVVRYCYDHSMDVAERDAMLRATLADAEQNHRFLVSLEGERFREGDITGRLAAWRVLLIDEEGRQSSPIEVQRVRRPSAAQLVYYPHITPHRASFRVAFPARREDGSETIPNGSRKVILRFAGPRGRVDLEWRLRPTSDESSGAEALSAEESARPAAGAEPGAATPPAAAEPAESERALEDRAFEQ